jgi:type IV secretory pathway TraG/TraD family ATPase VirD4
MITDNYSATNADKIHFHGLTLSVQDLFGHLFCSGTTSSGKTRSVARSLLRELLALHADDPRLKAGACIIDPKGDLAGYVREAMACCGRTDLVVIGPGREEQTFNPIGNPALSAAEVANLLISAAAQVGPEPENRARSGERFWEQADRTVLAAMVSACRHALALSTEGSQKLRIDHLLKFRRMLSRPAKELREWAGQLASELDSSAGTALLEFAALPEGTTRPCIAASIGAVLQAWAEPPLSLVANPAADRPEADLGRIISDGAVVIVNTAHAEHAAALLPAQMLLKKDFYSRVLARPRTNSNQERPVWLVIDEFNRVFSPQDDSEANFLEAARSSRCGAVLLTQNLSGLAHRAGGTQIVDKLVALTNTQIFLQNNDPLTIDFAHRSLGTKTVHRFHEAVDATLPPPCLFPPKRVRTRTLRTGVKIPILVPVADLPRLKTGELWIRTPRLLKRLRTNPAAP